MNLLKTSSLETLVNRFGIHVFYISAIILTLLVRNNAFFWDTVQLGSIHGQFYFDNNFSSFFLPENIDSGHPPTFGIYIAWCWKLFGKNLMISHLAMLPFLMGIIYHLKKIGKYFFDNTFLIHATILLFLFDPCLAGQAVLVSPDIVVVFFFLLSLNSIFYKKRIWLAIGIIGLCLISMRGVMVAAAIFSLDFLNWFLIDKNGFNIKKLFVNTLPYWFGVGLATLFLGAHYLETGWIGYHENSPWAPAFEQVDFNGFVKNILVLGWRLVDFGRIFLWIIILLLGLKMYQNKKAFDLKTKQLILLLLSLILFLTPALVIHKYLLGHRYLLPIFLVIDLIAFYFIYNSSLLKKSKILIFSICLLALSTGNLWIYPNKISQGWDSTLAHLPYYELRKKMINYIEKEKIPFQQIGSAFPNLLALKYIDLTEEEKHFEEKDLNHQEYIFYSNIFNDFSDDELNELEKDWIKIKAFEKLNVCVILYQKK